MGGSADRLDSRVSIISVPLSLTLATRSTRTARQEQFEALAFGVIEDFGGRSFFFDSALMQKDHVSGDVPRETHLVSHDHHGSAFGC
jgi:hypothetical protein